MFWIKNKKTDLILDILQDVRGRINHLEESIRTLKDEVRRIHMLQTCGAENLQYKKIIERIDKIDDNLSTIFVMAKE